MDELSNDQLIAVFGKGFEDLKLQSVQQTKILQNVEKILDIPSITVDGRTLVTVRFICESLGYKVDWDAKRNTVLITSK